MAEKLTVIIPCKDEEANIRGCLHSAGKVADEIIVADSGSTDRTLELVRNMDGTRSRTRIIEREYVNSGDFKNWAIPQATCEWVLILDADERIPNRLAHEIRELLKGDAAQDGPAQDGYWVYRASFFMGHRVRFSGWQNDRVLRLFRRDLGRYQGDTDHAEVSITTGRVSRLRNRMLHYSYWTYHDYFQRMERYSTYQALKWQEQGRPMSLVKMVCNLPLRFLQLYFLRLGFLDGLVGFQLCLLTAVYSFSKQACLWQLLHGRTPMEVNQDAVDVLVADELPPQHHRIGNAIPETIGLRAGEASLASAVPSGQTAERGVAKQDRENGCLFGYALKSIMFRGIPQPAGQAKRTTQLVFNTSVPICVAQHVVVGRRIRTEPSETVARHGG